MTTTIAEQHDHAWFALADAESCRLLCCSLTTQGTQHVEDFDVIKNKFPEQEHMRPMSGEGETHSLENKERLFAGGIVKWLQAQAGRRKIDALVIFAPPRMLGLLRVVPLGALKGHVRELRGDLMRLSAGQLANHPLIRELLTPQPGDEQAALDSATLRTHRAPDGSRPEHAEGGV